MKIGQISLKQLLLVVALIAATIWLFTNYWWLNDAGAEMLVNVYLWFDNITNGNDSLSAPIW